MKEEIKFLSSIKKKNGVTEERVKQVGVEPRKIDKETFSEDNLKVYKGDEFFNIPFQFIDIESDLLSSVWMRFLLIFFRFLKIFLKILF